jgi:type IV pilus assembly protein PilO
MTRTKKWTVGTALLVLLLLVAGWLLLVSPKRADADQLRAQAATQQAANAQLTTKIAQLKAQQQQLPAQEAKLADIRQRIPQTPALPQLVRSLAAIAATTNVTVVKLQPSPPAVPSAAATAATTKPTTPAPDGSVLQIVGVSFQLQGSYYNVERFISRLEQLKRAVQVTGFQMQLNLGNNADGTPLAPPAVGVSPVLKVDVDARVFMSRPLPVDPTKPGTTGTASTTTPVK